jgi:uncharacterized membrane protein YtjA (UPF0391 family)
MLKWALVFGLMSIVAGVLGFGGVAAEVAQAAQVLLMVVLSAFLLSLFLGLYVIETAE